MTIKGVASAKHHGEVAIVADMVRNSFREWYDIPFYSARTRLSLETFDGIQWPLLNRDIEFIESSPAARRWYKFSFICLAAHYPELVYAIKEWRKAVRQRDTKSSSTKAKDILAILEYICDAEVLLRSDRCWSCTGILVTENQEGTDD